MPTINLVVHPKHDPFTPTMWETWELVITGLRDVQYIALKQHSDEIHVREEEDEVYVRGRARKSAFVTATYYIDGAGPGRFPPISSIRPFIDEIKSWGYDLLHMSCPAPDEFSTCTFTKTED